MKLEPIIEKELNKLSLPNHKTTVRKYCEVHPDYDTKDKSPYFIQISIGSKSDDPSEDCICSYLDFWYNKKERRLHDICISLKDDLKGKGFGRGLVEAMEEVGKKLACDKSRIYLNTNPSFWEHMGYSPKGDYWEKQI